MSRLRILDRDYQVRPLTDVERASWHLYVRRAHAEQHWADLYRSIHGLPAELQATIVARCPLPDAIDRLSYFAVASRPAAVRKLLSIMVVGDAAPVLTPENAAAIFWVLAPLIADRPVELSGGDALARLRAAEPPATEEHDGRLSR